MGYQWVEQSAQVQSALSQLALKVELSEGKQFRMSKGWAQLLELMKVAARSTNAQVIEAQQKVYRCLDIGVINELQRHGVAAGKE